MAATPNQIDQQRRVILATKASAGALLDILNALHADTSSYTRLGLGDDALLADGAFEGTGTDRAAYRAAITSIAAIEVLLGQGHGTNLETFAR